MALILNGWFPNTSVEGVFRAMAREFAPDVRLIVSDGREPSARRDAWAAADLFTSLSDNIQETFGLTPVEAMAAALPVVVSDYDGYRDTVRDGMDGFRVPTWAPGPGAGQSLARGAEVGALSYDRYCWAAAAATAVDIGSAADAFASLIADPALRRRLGEAGRARAKAVYDWSVVYRQYQELWGELNARRLAAAADPREQARARALAPAAASRLDPFDAFAHYPTARIDLATRIALAPGVTSADLGTALGATYFGSLTIARPRIEALFAQVAAGETTIRDAAVALKASGPLVIRIAALLLKIGLVRVAP